MTWGPRKSSCTDSQLNTQSVRLTSPAEACAGAEMGCVVEYVLRTRSFAKGASCTTSLGIRANDQIDLWFAHVLM